VLSIYEMRQRLILMRQTLIDGNSARNPVPVVVLERWLGFVLHEGKPEGCAGCGERQRGVGTGGCQWACVQAKPNTITIGKYLSLPGGDRPTVRYQGQSVNIVYRGPAYPGEERYTIRLDTHGAAGKRPTTALEISEEQPRRSPSATSTL